MFAANILSCLDAAYWLVISKCQEKYRISRKHIISLCIVLSLFKHH